jgi:dimethylargininase
MVTNELPSTFHPQTSSKSTALVRPPGKSFVNGLSQNSDAMVDYDLALEQHTGYCKTLEDLGLEIVSLPVLEYHPDSCFIEDTVLITELVAIITRPGHPSRLKEVEDVKDLLKSQSLIIESIKAPGTLDGGDVLRVHNQFFIGRSQRTNQSGAWQLGEILTRYGFTATEIPVKDFLHLKSAVTWLGGSILIGHQDLEPHFQQPTRYQWIAPEQSEVKCANTLRIHDEVLIPRECPKTQFIISELGFNTICQDISEFEKKDGSLSCLSVVF